MLVRLFALAAVVSLSACAAAMPGYIPPPLTENTNKFAKPLESGEIGADGRYHMSEAETAMDCKRITGSMQITLSRLKDGSSRAEPSAIAKNAQQTVAPVFGGSGVGADRQAIYARERAKLDAYNHELAARNCATLDIDAELARTDPVGRKY
jgi:hypothetical protein